MEMASPCKAWNGESVPPFTPPLGRRRKRVSHYWNGPPPDSPGTDYLSWQEVFTMEISTIGIDLSKTTFHMIGLSARGEIVLIFFIYR